MQIRPTGPAPAKVMIVGEYPDRQDVDAGSMFASYTGKELSAMLQEAGLSRAQCFVTSVVRIAPPGGDIGSFIALSKDDVTPQHGLIRDLHCLAPVWEGIDILKREIELVRPNIIIALGSLALWALCGKGKPVRKRNARGSYTAWASGVATWRGSQLETDLQLGLDYKPQVISTFTPAYINRQWSDRPICVHDLRRASIAAKSFTISRPDYRFITRPGFAVACSVLEQLIAQTIQGPIKLSVDIETRAAQIACIGLAWSDLDAICIPLMCAERLDGYWTFEEEATIHYLLYRLLTHRNCHVIGQNFLYDAQYFYRHLHYIPNLVRDTMLSQHVCFSNMPKGLDFLSSMYCHYHEYWKDEGKEWDAKTGEDQLWVYNCKDAVITFEVDSVEQSNIDAMRLREVHDFQQSLFRPVLTSMNRGIRVDAPKRQQFAMTLLDEIAKRETWLSEVLTFPLNIRSPKQMQEVFYGLFKQKPITNRKTGSITCDDEALSKIAAREPILRPVVKKIQELRSLGVFLSTFVNAALDSDGRIRCSFNIAGTETYRFSSSTNAFGTGLNLQNIPKGSDDDELELPNVRSLFIPDSGYTFFDIDLASADLRIVVWESDEPEMKSMLREGLDPYTEIAKEFYHDPSITKKDPRRQTFKSFAHGTNYLGTAKGLAERLGLPVHQAEQTQRWYFQRFPRIKAWQDNLKDQVTKRRMVENIFGYRQYFFDRIEGTIFNQAAAWIPQSTVACLINRAYVTIHETLPHVEVLLQVHDSLAGQFPSHLGDHAVKQIVSAAEIVLPYSDPLVIPVGVKTSTKSWGDCD